MANVVCIIGPESIKNTVCSLVASKTYGIDYDQISRMQSIYHAQVAYLIFLRLIVFVLIICIIIPIHLKSANLCYACFCWHRVLSKKARVASESSVFSGHHNRKLRLLGFTE